MISTLYCTFYLYIGTLSLTHHRTADRSLMRLSQPNQMKQSTQPKETNPKCTICSPRMSECKCVLGNAIIQFESKKKTEREREKDGHFLFFP